MVESFSLDNGMRVMLAPTKGTDTVSVLVLVQVGSRYEYASINGASHFIEHMLFKGTRRRPTAQHISRALDGIGADYNAFTGKSKTGYYVKIDKSHLELGIDILSDMLFHSKFDPAEMNRERGAIVEEIRMYEENPMMHVADLLEQVMFEGGSLGWEIAGTPKIIREIDRDEMFAFHKQAYQPRNMVLVVSGNIDRRVRGWIEKRFGSQKNLKEVPGGFDPAVLPEKQKTPRVAVQTKSTEQVQLAIGFPSIGYDDDRAPAAALMATILGGNMSSRLFVEVRERKGLAYMVNARQSTYDDTGNLMIRAGLDKDRLKIAMKTILKEVRKMRREPVSARELREAKTFLRGQMAIRMEDSYQRAQWYGMQRLFKSRVQSPAGFLKKIDAVRAKDIQALAKEVFDLQRMSIAAVGPYKNAAAFLKAAGM